MKEELEKLVAAGKISRQHVEPLLQLVQSGFAMHRSWGFGKVKAVDTVFARLTIDFHNKPGHSMDLGFAAESLKAIPSEHILARNFPTRAAGYHVDELKYVRNVGQRIPVPSLTAKVLCISPHADGEQHRQQRVERHQHADGERRRLKVDGVKRHRHPRSGERRVIEQRDDDEEV